MHRVDESRMTEPDRGKQALDRMTGRAFHLFPVPQPRSTAGPVRHRRPWCDGAVLAILPGVRRGE
jgi:hypothetical protein